MSVLLYIIAVLMGLSLGLIGAGGAIVAVPAFVYLGGIPPTVASGYALFVAAVATAIGSVQYIRQRLVDWRSVLAFGATTLLTIALVRRFVLPLLPEQFDLGTTTVQLGTVLMLGFGAILMGAGAAMLRKQPAVMAHPTHLARLTIFGLIIGVVSGFLGVGGGFLMTPALVLWANLEMKKAVGTSLVLIAVNGAAGVAADLAGNASYDWPFLLTFTGLTSAGIIAGTLLAARVDGARLKAGFGYFVLILGIAVLLRESLS
ncbi:MAG: sulfite exporter TauE/SafE family protein [Candidatus Kapaibacteriota bacterium]